MNEIEYVPGQEEIDEIKEQPPSKLSWLTPDFVRALTELLKIPAYTKVTKTKITFTDKEWKYLLDKGYIRIDEDGKPEIVNREKVVEILRGEYKVR